MKNKSLKILSLIIILCFSIFSLFACSNVGTQGSKPNESDHVCEYGEWVSNGNDTHTKVCKTNSEHKKTEDCFGGNATCKDKALCSACGVEYGVLVCHAYENNKCKWCLSALPTYTRNGSVILFGSYPQTEVKDEGITNKLLKISGNPKTSTTGWISYNYYVDGVQTDCMYYKDVEYNGQKYRGVYIKKYRPHYHDAPSNFLNTTQDSNGYIENSTYWFLWEEIKWNIVKEQNGNALVVCDIIIDSQPYQNTFIESDYIKEFYNNNPNTPEKTYANNYMYSTIRAWLNETFYKTAFNSLQQEMIRTVEVDNSAKSTGYEINRYSCVNTFDKIFLLSREEINIYYNTNLAKLKNATNYAKSQGLWLFDSDWGWWWSRSACNFIGDGAYLICEDGKGGSKGSNTGVNVSNTGILPALNIKL